MKRCGVSRDSCPKDDDVGHLDSLFVVRSQIYPRGYQGIKDLSPETKGRTIACTLAQLNAIGTTHIPHGVSRWNQVRTGCGSNMCRAVTCHKCGKGTWAGCGQHVDQVMLGVAEPGRCQGHARDTGAEFLTKLFGR